MILIKALDGPFAGRVRDVSNVNIQDLFDGLVSHDWNWQIDYSQATNQELFFWGKEEMVYRILRHLTHGRVVKFLGRNYRGLNQASALDDAISSRKESIIVLKETSAGLELGINTQSSAN